MRDLLPLHTLEEKDLLKNDIEANGIQAPVVLDDDGNIIDGFLRVEIAEELGLDWSKAAKLQFDLTEIEKQALRIRLNHPHRRTPPTQQQRKRHRQILLMAHSDMSDQWIADLCGVGRSTVQRERKELAQTGRLEAPLATVGKDGKRRKVNSQASVIVTGKRELKRVIEDWKTLKELGGDLPKGLVPTKRLGREAKSARRKKRREGKPVADLPDNIQLHYCDFQQLEVEPGSVDLVFTDVLWSQEAATEWRELAELAAIWLKPNGILATYIGTSALAELFRQMAAGGLYYQRLFPVVFPQFAQSCKEVCGVTAQWRPVVAFSIKPGIHDFGGMLDMVYSNQAEKDWHQYQQALAPTRTLIEQLSLPGDSVVDPCMGTGTTALACLTAEGGPRRFLGCDRDEDMCKSTRMRIDEHLQSNPQSVEQVDFLEKRQSG